MSTLGPYKLLPADLLHGVFQFQFHQNFKQGCDVHIH